MARELADDTIKMAQPATEEAEPDMATPYDWQVGKTLAGTNRYMLNNEIGCDVAFLLGDDRSEVYAHKYVLISRSCVFCAMLHGPMAEKTSEYIHIPDIKRETFKQLLEYMYCEDTKVDTKNASYLLYAARKYGIDALEEKCVRILEHGITIENVCEVVRQAYQFDEHELKKKCLDFIFHHPKDILRSNNFSDLPDPVVREIIQADELAVKEEIVFDALLRWSEMECMRQELPVTGRNQRRIIGGMLKYIRFPLMPTPYLNSFVFRSDILSHEEIRDIGDYFSGKSEGETKFKFEKRSLGDNQVLHWRFGPVSCIHNEETAISFSASRQVLVQGVQIDGSVYSNEIYEADLSIFDTSNKELGKVKTKLDIKKNNFYDVLFHAAPRIDKGYKYTVILKIQGTHGYYGTSGKSSLPLRDSSSTVVNPDGEFSRIITNKNQVPAILVKPYIPAS
ncbi:BTB/POZ domain-containing protein 2-like isoform X1 [Pecten maximus]|uniref:BTB/POZ domain-containing protein 2-like isoform X1 n=2 Tax=Pecten maximus TaxID=6579 RepID=UPI001458FD69|nr:BTB/POZ domain-containing protein 2-like isoform X1 [Pecten maximus]